MDMSREFDSKAIKVLFLNVDEYGIENDGDFKLGKWMWMMW